MRKAFSLILGLAFVLSLVACQSTSGKAKATDNKIKETVKETKKEKKKDKKEKMKEVLEARVEEIHEESILVKDKQGVPYLVLSKVKDIKKGDTVKITYNGVIATSDPGQITSVYSIEKK